MSIQTNLGLTKFSVAFVLVVATISLLLVLERTTSALWQWYMFVGYNTAGVITLSERTAWVYTSLSLVLIMLCVIVGKAAKAQQLKFSVKLSNCATVFSIASLVLYWAIALSPLNMWRM